MALVDRFSLPNDIPRLLKGKPGFSWGILVPVVLNYVMVSRDSSFSSRVEVDQCIIR